MLHGLIERVQGPVRVTIVTIKKKDPVARGCLYPDVPGRAGPEVFRCTQETDIFMFGPKVCKNVRRLIIGMVVDENYFYLVVAGSLPKDTGHGLFHRILPVVRWDNNAEFHFARSKH